MLTAEGAVKETFIPERPLNVREGFNIALQRYRENHDDELLIIIDEFETIPDRSLLAPYLKSTRGARFVLVGIAETTLDLVGEHASVARGTHAVQMGAMSEDELRMILALGSQIVGQYCTFETDAIEEVVDHCYGSPFWCHFLGKALLEQSQDSAGGFEEFVKRSTPKPIWRDNVTSVLQGLPRNPQSLYFEQILQSLTLADETTARVLLNIARQQQTPMSSSVVCKSLDCEGIPRGIAMETINGLLEMGDSPFKVRGRIRDIVSFSFEDPHLKRYILIRNADLPPGEGAAS